MLVEGLTGLPQIPPSPEVMETLKDLKVNPTGDLPEPMPILEAAEQLDRIHEFQRTEADTRDDARQFGQLKGQSLVDRAGVVRCVNVECSGEGPAGFGQFPIVDELLAAARTLA
jgi:hypothetical protein